jgi:hypothetical protein
MGLLGLAAATSPSTVTVRSSAGVNGSDRVELIWADGAIQQQWLEVTVKARVVKILRWCAFVLMSGQLNRFFRLLKNAYAVKDGDLQRVRIPPGQSVARPEANTGGGLDGSKVGQARVPEADQSSRRPPNAYLPSLIG